MTIKPNVIIRIVTPPPLVQVPLRDWGVRVAEARLDRDLSQMALGRACGVTQQTISKVEHGEICPHDRLKVRLAAALEVPPAILFPWTAATG